MKAGIRFSTDLYVEFEYDTATHKITALALEGSDVITAYSGYKVLSA